MTPFSYHRVSQDLVRELHQKVSDGQSVVLLGPRYGGKRYVMDRVRALLCDAGITPIMHIRLLAESPLCTSPGVAELIREAAEGVEGLDPASLQTDDPFELLELLAAQTQKPLVLFAANVDSMSHHLACRFLQKVRTLVTNRHLVVVMSGENNFRELVHGENSEFNCANQYVLQGYTLDEFGEFLGRYLLHLHITFSDLDAAARRMWEITGGNLYILRTILWSLIQQRARVGTALDTPVGVEGIPSTFKLTGIPGAYGSHIFRHATQLIARELPCWEELERLIADGQLRVLLEDAPGRLELAGIAIKEVYDGHATLKFSSPMMEAFVKRFYDARRFGDLYASVGRWDEAFKRYNQLDPEERVRPSGTDDRAEVEATVGMLCASLYAEVAAEGKREERILHTDAVRRLFARGCFYVLGFREITFWQRDMMLGSPEWRHHPLDTSDPSDEVMALIKTLLPGPAERNLSPGILNLYGTMSKYAIAAVLPARLNKQTIVVVSDFTAGSVISQERKGLIRQVLEHFIGAYKHAGEVDNFQVRHRVLLLHDDIISSIFNQIGTPSFNVRSMLVEAARGLRKLDYSRVLFCLVNKDKTRILGEVDDSDDPTINVADRTDWPLDNPTADLQPYVVRNKEPKIVRDARREPLANQKIVRDAGMRAEAIIPILNRAEEVLGTVHVERADGAVPTREQVDDLMAFGRQLAVAIEQCKNTGAREELIMKSVADKTMATMAHNLGTRLGSLYVILDRYRYMAKKCKEIGRLNEEFADIITYAETTVKRANEFLSPVSPRLESVDVCETILRTLQVNLTPEAWTLQCDEALPTLPLDVHLFDTALLELIRNSRVASAAPDEMVISIRVESCAHLGVGGVNITYRDNGPGVPAEYSERIFDDFFSYRPSRKSAGTGLGLGFVRRVMIAHGGSIYYSTNFLGSGHTGAEFTISLPCPSEAGLREEATRV